MPAMVAKYKEKQRITQLQKAYSVLTQAFNMAVNENGTVDNWNLTHTQTGEVDESGNTILDSSGQVEFANKLRPYIKKTSVKAIKREGSYSLDGRQFGQDSIPTTDRYNGQDSYRIVLSDGVQISPGWIENCRSNGFCAPLWITLPEKKQITGVTNFYFYIFNDRIIPAGLEDGLLNITFNKHCDSKNSSGISSDMQGRGCTGWVLTNKNMEYMKCNDLSWNGKNKCK